MITALNEDTNLVQDLTITGEGRLLVESTPKYIDLGQIINASLAAYAEVLATPVEDIDWVRHAIVRTTYIGGHIDETCSARLYRRTASGDAGAAPVELTTFGGEEIPNYSAYCSAVDIAPGYGAQFAVLNNGGYSVNVTLSAQLLG